MPLWTVVFGWLLLGERVTPDRVAALALGSAGLVVLVAPQARAVWDAPAGASMMLAAAVLWALGTVMTKAFRWTIPTATLTGWQLVLGALPVAVGALARVVWGAGDAGRTFADMSPAGVAGLVYATLVGVTFCHWAWFELVAVLPAPVAAIGILGIPIVGVFSSALILREPGGAAEVAALGLVVAGLAVLMVGVVRTGGSR